MMQDSGSSVNRGSKGDLGGHDSAADIPGDLFCTHCRSIGHVVRDCRRGQARVMPQEIERDIPLCKFGAPICAAQLEGYAFFCIPNRPYEVHVTDSYYCCCDCLERCGNCYAGGRGVY
jgi:hypothetical protein